MAITVVAVFAAFAPSAFATMGTTAYTTYGSLVPGASTDYTIRQDFTYGNGTEPAASSGAGQDLKKWIVDSPAGLVGNPNAIPEGTRCDPTAFDPSGVMSPYVDAACPAGSQVGSATVYLVSDAASNEVPAGTLVGTLSGKIYLLKTSPEVPTTLATRFTSTIYQSAVCSSLPGTPTTPCTIYPKTKSVLAPVTNMSTANNGDVDFRIRIVPADYSSAPSTYGPTGLPYPHPWFAAGATPLHIMRIDQKLFGMVDPNNTPLDPSDDAKFLSMPTRCDNWDSYSYAIDQTGTGSDSLAMDPNHPADNYYVKSAANTVTPDCTTKPPLKAVGSATVSSTARGANPGLSVTVADPTASGDDNPKKIVNTLPAALSVDVDALNHVCTIAERDSNTCPAASQVGTAKIETPLISAGLTGKIYMTTGATASLPFLSILVDGAENPIHFRLDATTRFVGPNFNQIETTFNELPQTPLTKFTVNIDGGKSDSLFYSRSCPTDGSSPQDGPITFAIDGYSGQSTSSSSSTKFDGCYGKPKVTKFSNCVKQSRTLKFTPRELIDTAAIEKIAVLDGAKKSKLKTRATDKSAPFKFKVVLKKSKYKKNTKYYYQYKVTYKDGTIVKSDTGSFKTCK
jgi:hypothetical protein